jgi:hypothetical protein
MIELVANLLGDLRDDVAFVGGVAASLLVTDPAAPDVRSTKDVDVIIRVISRPDYYRLEKKLVELGFKRCIGDDIPICRWLVDDVEVDVMPTEASILGFSNQWYEKALNWAEPYILPGGTRIGLVTAPYFLATKIEAFRDRGHNDYLASEDLEDIIVVIDGREALLAEIGNAPDDLKSYLAGAFREFLKNNDFVESVPGHLYPDAASQARLDLVLEKMKQISRLVEY